MIPSALMEALHCALAQRVPPFVWGACGIGKSDIIRDFAASLKYDFVDIRAVLLDPVDLRGLPRIHDDKTQWVPPDFLPTKGQGILFLDELTSAPQMVQAACYQLVLDRRLGEYVLPEGWQIIAAGNPPAERGVHFAMPRPLQNRFWHLTLEPDLIDWCRWAIHHNVRPELIAFLRFRPQLLHAADLASGVNAWPTPRSNVMASRILEAWLARHADLDPLLLQLLEGAIGSAAAGEFYSFLHLFRNLPSTDEILLNPSNARLPQNDPSASFAIATALGRVINDRNIDKAAVYLDRMEPEFHVLAMRDASVRDNAITSTKAFVNFGVRFGDLVA